MKFLLWALVIYLAWRWYQTKKDNASGAAGGSTTEAGSVENMVACAHCGVHLPQSEAVRGEASLHYCSDAHRIEHLGR
jgi:uncharacterized protein